MPFYFFFRRIFSHKLRRPYFACHYCEKCVESNGHNNYAKNSVDKPMDANIIVEQNANNKIAVGSPFFFFLLAKQLEFAQFKWLTEKSYCRHRKYIFLSIQLTTTWRWHKWSAYFGEQILLDLAKVICKIQTVADMHKIIISRVATLVLLFIHRAI